eukprot:scaffold19106_cov74-Isochrysis_galbana.AAC.1
MGRVGMAGAIGCCPGPTRFVLPFPGSILLLRPVSLHDAQTHTAGPAWGGAEARRWPRAPGRGLRTSTPEWWTSKVHVSREAWLKLFPLGSARHAGRGEGGSSRGPAPEPYAQVGVGAGVAGRQCAAATGWCVHVKKKGEHALSARSPSPSPGHLRVSVLVTKAQEDVDETEQAQASRP